MKIVCYCVLIFFMIVIGFIVGLDVEKIFEVINIFVFFLIDGNIVDSYQNDVFMVVVLVFR